MESTTKRILDLYTLNANVLGNGYFDRKDLEVIGNIHENPELNEG